MLLLFNLVGVKTFQHWISCLKKSGSETQENVLYGEKEFSLYNPLYLKGWHLLAGLSDGKKEKKVFFSRFVNVKLGHHISSQLPLFTAQKMK